MRSASLWLALPLAACSPSGNESAPAANASATAEPAAAAAPSGLNLSPGQWQVGFTLERISAPDAPPELAAQVAKQNADLERAPRTRIRSLCITPTELANAAGNVLTGTDGAICRFERLDRDGERLDGVLTCRHGGDAAPATATLSGTMVPARYDLALTMKVPDGRGANLVMGARTTGERTGTCAS